MKKERLIFEIGVEEIPSQYIKTMSDSLKSNAITMFKELRLNYDSLEVCFTPRRFALIVNGLDTKQATETKIVKGPGVSVAYENDGVTPSRALLGFLNKYSMQPTDVITLNEGDKQYVALSITFVGQNTVELLLKPLAALVESIYCPNPMRWGAYKIKFIRPIRWLLALYGDVIIPVRIECAIADNKTYGHRTLADGLVEVPNAYEYEEILKNVYVILNEEERKNIIRSQISKIEKEFNFSVEKDEVLLEKVSDIVEYPTCAVGHFEKDYLQMPECIIKTPLKTQQCYFPVYVNQCITNAFIYVRNGGMDHLDNVTRGNERVLRPRLADAKFFYENDCKHTLKEMADRLSEVVFVEGAGTYADKSIRVAKIARRIAELVGYDETDKIDQVSALMKADLVSSIVREYTEIQGVIGGVFAANEGYSSDVCQAIGEQYLPNFSGDKLPTGILSSIISIADKLDSVMCLSAAGLRAVGSSDPYGQRRQVLSIFLIALEQSFNIDLEVLIEECSGLYADFYDLEGESVAEYVKYVHVFFLQRLRVFLHDAKRIPVSDIEKISVDELNIVKSMKKAEMIHAIENTEWYQQFILIFNRIQKLIKKEHVKTKFDISIIDDEAANMFQAFDSRRDKIISLISEEQYSEAIRLIADCSKEMTFFMEAYHALCDDDEKRNNRIAFFYDFCAICGKIIQLNQ